MNTHLEGFPDDLAVADLGASAVTITLDAAVYPLEALYGAAYIFIDRCYVLVDRPSEKNFRATLSLKKAPAEPGPHVGEALRSLAGEFVNELLSCAWRYQIAQENRAIIEQVTAQAMSGAMGAPTLDELEQFDFSEEPFEDPLGISKSWEDKYKKREPDAKPEAAAATAAEPTAETSAKGGERA